MTTFSENGFKKLSINADTQAMLEVARKNNIETGWKSSSPSADIAI